MAMAMPHESETADDTRLHQIVIETQQKLFRNDGSVQTPVHCEYELVHCRSEFTAVSSGEQYQGAK